MKKKNLKTFAFTLLMCASVLLASCGGIPVPPTLYEVNLDVDKNVSAHLKVAISNQLGMQAATDGLIAGFKQAYPNVEIETVSLPYGSFNQSIIQMHNAESARPGSMPDIVYTDSASFSQLVSTGILLDLEPYVDASESAAVFAPEDDFYQSFWKAGQADFDGDQYMIPRSADRMVCLYNETMLEALGVDMTPVKDGWSWDRFTAFLRDVKTAMQSQASIIPGNNTVPACATYSWEANFYPILSSFGAKVFDEDGAVAIDSQATRSALELMRGSVTGDALFVKEDSMFLGGQCPVFLNSTSIATLNSQWAKADIKFNGKVCKANAVSFPDIGTDPKHGIGVVGYGLSTWLSNDPEKRDVAWQFLNYMLTQQGQNSVCSSEYNPVPIRKDMADYTKFNWGNGMTGINLDAYLYNPLGDQLTDFTAKKDIKYSQDLMNDVADLVNNVVYKSIDIEKAISDCKRKIESDLNKFI